ncbi:hypothetical protein [Bradyrhizobium symbiodeficiens]|uniref:hypothetical protein n=1 Tax=Bradyrhizobium symbiodeficiens TaxID=1404367 RepID=UPI00140FC7CA|nr:hypothetical protein [Bradyrhizobium symbiodeficiens]QIO98823.1 hypothetical protein HAU86_02925 [Bradyrhizobium symbiodeficiens]
MTAAFFASPPDALKAALDGIQRRAATRGFLTPNLQKADPKALQLCWPHRLAFVQLNELLANETLRGAARISGWRFFVFDSKAPIAAAHVMRTDRGELRLSELNEGQFVVNTLDALKTIFEAGNESKDELNLPSFELLLLVAPAVCFVGWWAQFEDQHDDWVLPVTPTVRGIEPKRIEPKKLIPLLKEEFFRASHDLVTS